MRLATSANIASQLWRKGQENKHINHRSKYKVDDNMAYNTMASSIQCNKMH